MSKFGRRLVRPAMIAALIVAFGVAGCGRKGSLDLPPTAAPAEQAAPGKPAPAQGEDKRILLDHLLN